MSDSRTRWRVAGLAVLALALAALVAGWNPASLPDSWIERWILRKLPLGSSIVAVRNAIEEEGWKTIEEGVTKSGSLVIVDLGHAPFAKKSVAIEFTFDRFGRLVEVDVERQ